MNQFVSTVLLRVLTRAIWANLAERQGIDGGKSPGRCRNETGRRSAARRGAIDKHLAAPHWQSMAIAAAMTSGTKVSGMTTGDAAAAEGSLLLVLALGVHQKDGRLYIENQASNGLIQWLRHFERMTLGVKLFPGSEIPATSIPIDSLGLGDRLDVFLMPPAWTPLASLRALPLHHGGGRHHPRAAAGAGVGRRDGPSRSPR